MKKLSINLVFQLKLFFMCFLTLISFADLHAQKGDTVYVNIAAIDQPLMFNRMGAALPTGMIFALMSDLEGDTTKPGMAYLKSNKRPRPIVLRANVGNVVNIRFTNLLTPYLSNNTIKAYPPYTKPAPVTQAQAIGVNIYPTTRAAGIHIAGMEMGSNISDDASYNGNNPTSLANPGETRIYYLIAAEEGTFMLHSAGAVVGNTPTTGGQLTNGLFGSINIQPPYAEWYRSQVTEAELDSAITHYKNLYDGGVDKKSEYKKYGGIYDLTNEYPLINYNATFSSGKPVLKMYKEIKGRPRFRELVYTDLTAIITGPNAGDFDTSIKSPSFLEVEASPNRRSPYREFSIHYHEAPWVVQAFPVFYNSNITNTLKTGVDNFAINYGSAGVGAEVYANRIGVGPMANCGDCAYEEFFLSSWAVGDPASIVDIPANANAKTTAAANSSLQNQFLFVANNSKADKTISPSIIPKASKVLYPDDPSNVYHSYMNDHVKFRITHAGMGLTHVHHQHAHQWLHSPNSDDGHYLDAQTINPGTSYTLEMVHGGSGNLNKTVGDQIFHCHFYPHFAQGMWSLWRVHDVLELGTKMDGNGIVADGARALPDGEISAGTPIPGLVPIPTLAMAPLPAEIAIKNGQVVITDTFRSPGFPFYIPGIAGSRPPNPPLDYAQGPIFDSTGRTIDNGSLNGGLPRSVIVEAKVPFENHTQYDWTKIIDSIQIIELPEDGTDVEKVAMRTHAVRNHPTFTPSGLPGNFILNGLPPQRGAPFSDPAIDKEGNPAGKKRIYKAAVIQLDVVLNKKGWHFPQQRIESLWEDVAPNISGIKAPEPLYFRANSKDDYIEFWHTNLVPQYYELDNFQVRTPTDIIGQHIHLVKFDVTASDGAADGWNYEDGTLSPDLVRERIHAINNGGKHYLYNFKPGKPIKDTSQYNTVTKRLAPQAPNPVWGPAPAGQNWYGAQTTIQRWYADPLLNTKKQDRTVRTVFTHDHFGPSTHQQVGLYSGLLVEPEGSTWKNASTGELLGTRGDGGPTTWAANIITKNTDSSYREFMLEFQDNQQAFLPTSRNAPDPYPEFTPNDLAGFTQRANIYRGWLQSSDSAGQSKVINSQTYSQLVSFGFLGTYSMNYRNEPLPMRLTTGANINNRKQAPGDAGDPAYVYKSMLRADPAFNTQPLGGSKIDNSSVFKYPVLPLGPGMNPTDPYTPLFRAYANDKIQIRTLVGAHVTSHFFNVHGINWQFEPSFANSGFRSTQNMGLSEHFEMNFRFPATQKAGRDSAFTDYLYNASSDATGLTGGLWGLMRAYDSKQNNLEPLPNNDISNYETKKIGCGCPPSAPVRIDTVYAININKYSATNKKTSLVYNKKYGITDPNAAFFIRKAHLNQFINDTAFIVEPLVLRANAGECIKVTLFNDLNSTQNSPTGYQYTTWQTNGNGGGQIILNTSSTVGLHAELLSYDVSKNDGSNVGSNPVQTIPVGSSRTYEWFAGKWISDTETVPVEFGTIALSSPDPLNQFRTGLIGALIIEPEGATWIGDNNSPSSATVFDLRKKLLFREFVLQFQDAPNLPNGFKAINYKTEPLASRLGSTNFMGSNIDSLTSVIKGSIETPRFIAAPGNPVRIRLVNSGSNGTGEVFNLHGHVWQEEPYTNNSTRLGNNDTSQWLGFRDQLGALSSFDLLIKSAGGSKKVKGDYLYSSTTQSTFARGMWGVMSVDAVADYIHVNPITYAAGQTNYSLHGVVTQNPDKAAQISSFISLTINGKKVNNVRVNKNGTWKFVNLQAKNTNDVLIFRTQQGGYLKTTLGNLVIKPLIIIPEEELKKMNDGVKPSQNIIIKQ